jgi:sortase (surface protein transpeptidase)
MDNLQMITGRNTTVPLERVARGVRAVRERAGNLFPSRLTSRRSTAPAPTTDVQQAASEAPRYGAQALPQLSEHERHSLGGTALILLGALLLGFAAQFAGISQISYSRDQQIALSSFRYELANATAPVGQVGPDDRLLALGTPVALLEAPTIGLRSVVLEGTTSAVTMSGPGHRRDTPLPGQLGASVVYGRQAAYGAPFASIAKLSVGDTISATTGQGVANYQVTGVRFTGSPLPPAMGAGEGRLTLVSASGIPFLSDSVVRVDAKLTSTVSPSPARVLGYSALGANELTMAGDPVAWPYLVLALIILAILLALFSLSVKYWGRWQTWIVAVPVLVALGSFAAQQVAILLPNLI